MKRGIAQNSALALGGDAASKVGALVVIIVAARFLSVPEFAVLATALAIAGVLASVLDLGAGTLITRDGARSGESRGALFQALLEARAPLAAAVVMATLLAGSVLARPFTALAVAALAVSGALTLSLLGLYRSCQDIRPEAIQRLLAAIVSVVTVVLASLLLPRADVLLLALALSTLAALLPLVLHALRIADFTGQVRPRTALRRAAPIGLLALATVAYYRSGTIALAALAGAHETAVFGVVASIAFGLLMLPNAITTALLPRLSAEDDFQQFIACARRALVWTLVVAVLLAGAAAAVVPVGLPVVLGSEYADAGVPFALLCVGVPLIAASGVIGTSLLSIGRLRTLGVQVAVTLMINLVALALLVPSLGATGAALSTVACEAAGLALLLQAARSGLPGLTALRPLAFLRRIEASSATTL
ncbi:MAG: oligosaccharide flippase family protein [Gaiellaceae bacterium]